MKKLPEDKKVRTKSLNLLKKRTYGYYYKFYKFQNNIFKYFKIHKYMNKSSVQLRSPSLNIIKKNVPISYK